MCSWLLLVAVIETCWWKLLCHICHCWEKLPRVAAHQNALVAGHAYLSHPQQRRYCFGLSPKPIFYLKWVEKTEVDESTSHPQSYAGSTCLLFEGWTSPRKNCFHLEPIWPPSVHWQVAAIPRAGGLAPINWLVTSAFTKTLGLVEGLHGPCFEGKIGKHKICERTEGGFMVVSFLMNPWDMQSTEACLRGCAEIWMYLSQYVSGGFQGSAFQIENHFQPTSSLNPQQRRRSGHDMLSWKFKLTMHLQKSLQSSGFVSSTGLIHNARAISGLLGITNTLMSGLQAATTPENVLYCVSIWIEKWNHLESGCIALSLVCNPSSFKVPTTDQPNSSVLIDGPVPNHPNHHGRMKFLKIHPAHGQLRGHVKRSMDSFPHPVLVGTGAIIVIVWPIIIVIYSDNVSQIHHMTRTHHRSVIHHSHNETQIRDRSMRKTHHRSSTLWTHHRQDVFQIHHSLRIRGDRWSHPHHSLRSIQNDRCMYRQSQAWCQILKDPSWYIDSSSQLRP